MMLDLQTIANALGGKICGDHVRAPGPGHSAKDDSLKVWLDPSDPDGFRVHSFASDDWQICKDFVRQKLGLDEWKPGSGGDGNDPFLNFSKEAKQKPGGEKMKNGHAAKGNGEAKGKEKTFPDLKHPEATFFYHDEIGNVLYKKVRYPLNNADGTPAFSEKGKRDKTFRYYHKDGKGEWTKGRGDAPEVPYNLHQLATEAKGAEENCDTPRALIFEGEGKAELFSDTNWPGSDGLTVTATSIPKGAEGYGPRFADFVVWIAPDNDVPGEEYLERVAAEISPHARSVHVIKLPGLGPKEDVKDWIPKHGMQAFFKELEAAPEWGGKGSTTERLLQTVADFLAGFVAPDYVVDGLFKRGYIYSLCAMTGGGKTAIALLISEIASNKKRRRKLGPHEVEHVRVVYIACENSEDVRMRLIGMEAKMDFRREGLDMLVIDKVFDLEKNMDRIFKEVEEFGGNVGLVFIDTSAAMFQGEDENNNPEMLKHAKLQRRLCELPGKPCVISLCHPPKHVDSPEKLLPRGAGAYLNEVDGNFTAWAHDERMSRLYWAGKLRGPDFEPIEFRLPTIYTMNLVDSKGRALPTVMAEVIGEDEIAEVEQKGELQEERLLKAIQDRPDGSMAEWATDCSWHFPAKPGEEPKPYKSLVARVLKRLIDGGLIKKKGRKYILTATGKETVKPSADIVPFPQK
jgi:hypothetical protein